MEHIEIARTSGRHLAFPGVAGTPDGTLVVVYREGAGHCSTDGRIVAVRSTDGGGRWTPDGGITVADTVRDDRDPAVAAAPDGRLVVTFFQNPNYTDDGTYDPALGQRCASWMVTSDDGGQTWAQARQVGVGACWSAMQFPADGSWVQSGYDQLGDPGRHGGFLRRSSDQGETWGAWQPYAQDAAGHVNFYEPAVCHWDDGRMVALLRCDTAGAGYLFHTESADWGRRWTPPRPTGVWGHPAHLLRLDGDRVLAVYGHRRDPIGVRACVSPDRGTTWDRTTEIVLRDDLGPSTDIGYPASTALPDGRILTVYYQFDRILGTIWRV